MTILLINSLFVFFRCTCERCEPMPTEPENVCCLESQKVQDLVDRYPSDAICVTDHMFFEGLCLNPWTLDAAWNAYAQQYGTGGRYSTVERRRRHTAYRNFVRAAHGRLGRHIRVKIPSCVVAIVRRTFPNESDDEDYTGYLPF